MEELTEPALHRMDAGSGQTRRSRHFDLFMAAFVTILLLSNIIGTGKVVAIDVAGTPFVFGAGILFFPVSYVLGDVLAEVYSYARARRCI